MTMEEEERIVWDDEARENLRAEEGEEAYLLVEAQFIYGCIMDAVEAAYTGYFEEADPNSAESCIHRLTSGDYKRGLVAARKYCMRYPNPSEEIRGLEGAVCRARRFVELFKRAYGGGCNGAYGMLCRAADSFCKECERRRFRLQMDTGRMPEFRRADAAEKKLEEVERAHRDGAEVRAKLDEVERLQGKTLQVLQDKTLLGERLQGEILQGMKLQDKTLQGLQGEILQGRDEIKKEIRLQGETLQGEILLVGKDARTAAHAGAGAQAEAARTRVEVKGARDAAGRAEDAAMEAARESMRTGAAVRNRQRELTWYADVVLTLQDWERAEYRDLSAEKMLEWVRGKGRLLGGMDARKLQAMRGLWRSRGKPDAGIFEAAWKKYHDKK